jgi:hypothetical protein
MPNAAVTIGAEAACHFSVVARARNSSASLTNWSMIGPRPQVRSRSGHGAHPPRAGIDLPEREICLRLPRLQDRWLWANGVLYTAGGAL